MTTTRYAEKFVTIHLDAMNADDAPDDGWPRAVFDALKALDVSQVAYVPDAGHKQLIEMAHADAAIKATTLTTEQEGIGLSAGAWLGGERTAVLMQSSGVGNCANALASVTNACQFPLLMLVTMRGEAGEGNPWQIPMGQATAPLLKLFGVEVSPLSHAADAGRITTSAGRSAFEDGQPTAILIRQRLIGVKAFEE